MHSSAVSSWVVLIYHVDQDAHAAHFPNFDKAEDFAKRLEDLPAPVCVSEPMPITATSMISGWLFNVDDKIKREILC